MEVEIVSHCFATTLPQYATFLSVQLNSLLRAPDYVVETVCYTEEDAATKEVLAAYAPRLGPRLRPMALTWGELGRRGIGRNHAATATRAALVWFADVDYFWGPGCFEALMEIWAGPGQGRTLLWPKTVMTQPDVWVGDEMLEAIDTDDPSIDTSGFIPMHPRKAIGGIQIIAGDYCRRYGYLNHEARRQRPLNPGDTMFRTIEDSVIRKHIATVGTAMEIDLPGVYRLRHTRNAYQYPDGRPRT